MTSSAAARSITKRLRCSASFLVTRISCVVERGDQQEPALGQRLLPGALDAHASNAAGRADHDRLGPAQQDFQAVRFDGGVEAAD